MDEDRHRKPQSIKVQNCGAHPQLVHYTTLAPKTQGITAEEGLERL